MKWLTLEKWNEHNNAMSCSIFAKPFKSTDEKVWDHDHLTGEYRGPGHNACNLNCRINPKKMKISCIIHHFKGILFLCYSSFHICQFLKLNLIATFTFVIVILIDIFISFYEFCKFYFPSILCFFCKLRFYAVSAFFQVFSVQLRYNLLYCAQDKTLTLYCQLSNHVMGKLLLSLTTWGITCPLLSTTSRSQARVNLCCPPLTKYLAS